MLDESPSNTTGNSAPVASGKASALQQYNLDANDPDVAEAILGKDGSEFKLAALEVAYKRMTKPQPDISASPTIQGGAQRGMRDDEADEKLGKLSLLYKEPTKNQKAIQSLESELKAAGKL